MKPSVYIETTIVSYLTARPAVDEMRRGQQVATEKWWTEHAHSFSLCTSQIVIDEAAEGDRVAAAKRLSLLSSIRLLEISPTVYDVADAMIEGRAVPEVALVDAFHLAVATVGRAEILLTWNCKHLANVMLRTKIERVCEQIGLRAPMICTPFELMETFDG